MTDYLELPRIYQETEPVKKEYVVPCRILWSDVKMIEQASPDDEEWINREDKVHVMLDSGYKLFFLASYQQVWAQWDQYRHERRNDPLRVFSTIQ